MGEEVLSNRSVVIHSHTLTAKEIATAHENLVRTGIDAIAYFKTDVVLAGRDPSRSFAGYFVRREITNLIFINKSPAGFTIYITQFNDKEDFVQVGQPAWKAGPLPLTEALTAVYRAALAGNKKKNLLINETPETDLPVRIITGQRAETFAYDLKADLLAIPTFGDTLVDRQLAELFSKNYTFRHQLVDNTISEKDLRNKGFLFVLCFVHTRNVTARESLNYPVTQSESAFVSVTYPNGEVQLKNIPGDTRVFKFYVRHIDSGNVFLGTKWDADLTWQQALQNYIKGLRIDMRI